MCFLFCCSVLDKLLGRRNRRVIRDDDDDDEDDNDSLTRQRPPLAGVKSKPKKRTVAPGRIVTFWCALSPNLLLFSCHWIWAEIDHLIDTISTYCNKYWMAAKAEIEFYAFWLKIWHPVTAFYWWSVEKYSAILLFAYNCSQFLWDLYVPSVLWRCWLDDRKGIRPVKTERWVAGMVICLERCADLHMALH